MGIALKCSVAGTFYFHTSSAARASANQLGFRQNLVTLEVTGAAATTSIEPAWSEGDVPRPAYLTSLGSAAHSFQLSTGGPGVTVPSPATHQLGIGQSCAGADTGCNYQPMPMVTGDYRFSVPVCSTVEATLTGGGGLTRHPIHIHVNHFQIVEGNEYVSGGWGQLGDWRDVIPAMGLTRMRFQTDKYTGAVMIHCHLLYHEDKGMMDRFWIGNSTATACTATSTSTCNAAVPSEAFSGRFNLQAYETCVLSSQATGTNAPRQPMQGVTIAPPPSTSTTTAAGTAPTPAGTGPAPSSAAGVSLLGLSLAMALVLVF